MDERSHYIAICLGSRSLSFNKQTGAVQAPLGSPIRTGGRYPQALAFSPNGKLLVVGNGIAYGHQSVRVFSVPIACADPDRDNDCDS